MPRRIRATLFAVVLTSLAPRPADAQALRYTIDTAHSRVTFRVRHLGVSWVNGEFRSFSGTFTFDSANAGVSTVEARIATHSIFTNNERRDNHLRSNDFFAADSFPEIRFVSTRVERGSEPSTYRLTGDLTIRGITRSVTLDVELMALRPTVGRGGTSVIAGFTARGRVNRRDFGLRWNNIIEGFQVAGDDVGITIDVEARAPQTS